MFELEISGFGRLALEYLILDYNGTIAFNGDLIPGIDGLIRRLSGDFEIHVLTADTRGTCREKLDGLPVRVIVLDSRPEDEAKLAHLRSLGADRCAAVGNGRNDRPMLEAAALGVAVTGPEGAATGTLIAADLVSPDIIHALELFTHPLRLIATLRT